MSCDTKYCFNVKDNTVTEYLRTQCLPLHAVIIRGFVLWLTNVVTLSLSSSIVRYIKLICCSLCE